MFHLLVSRSETLPERMTELQVIGLRLDRARTSYAVGAYPLLEDACRQRGDV